MTERSDQHNDNALTPSSDDVKVQPVAASNRMLTREEFQGLADLPPETEWFANIRNPNTRRAYGHDVREFAEFVGIEKPEEFRIVTRAHIIAWRKTLESRELAPATIRRKLSALSSLFDDLCECNAVTDNPVHGVKRPTEGANQGKTPALGNAQVRTLLKAPDPETLKGKRDQAILATLLFHGLRREELCKLRVRDIHTRQGTPHLRVHGKREKLRYVPLSPVASRLIDIYLDAAGHRDHREGALFRPVKNNVTGTLNKHLELSAIYALVRRYGEETGISLEVDGLCAHSMRATAATNALENDADLAEVQEWLGHANVSTTRIYDHRGRKPEDSPTFRVRY